MTGRFHHYHAALARLLPDAGKNCAAKTDGDADCRGDGRSSASSRSSSFTATGQSGAARMFAISGFAEASRAYFNKDLKDITAAEAALLAGIIQGPAAYRLPASERLWSAVTWCWIPWSTRTITREQAKRQSIALKLAPPNVEASDAPYFVDMVRDTLINKFSEHDLNDQSYAFTRRSIPTCRRRPRRPSKAASSWWTSRSRSCAPSG